MTDQEQKELSRQALELIGMVFGEKSNLQLPAGIAGEIVEIREWVKKKSTELNPPKK